jgi:hypothetical protein
LFTSRRQNPRHASLLMADNGWQASFLIGRLTRAPFLCRVVDISLPTEESTDLP